MRTSIFMVGVLCCALVSTSRAGPTVLPGGSTVAGKTIGEWTADWWNWTGSVTGNAFTDQTGAQATVNQSGPVFFIAGTQGGTATRSFNVPGDKFLLFPLLNTVVANGPDPGFATTLVEAKALGDALYSPEKLIASIDGADVPDLGSHREISPVNFTYTVQAGSTAFPAGTYTDANADGYWLMVNPLGSGTHTLHFGGTTNAFVGPDPVLTIPSSTIDVTDTVSARGASAIPLPPAMLSGLPMLAGALGAVRMMRRRMA